MQTSSVSSSSSLSVSLFMAAISFYFIYYYYNHYKSYKHLFTFGLLDSSLLHSRKARLEKK